MEGVPPAPESQQQSPTPPVPTTNPPVPSSAAAPEGKLMQNAISFLKDPRVVNTPLSRRVNFLKSRGLSIEEIHEAFRLAGQEIEIEKIRNIVNVVPTNSSTSKSTPAPPPRPTATPQQPNMTSYVPSNVAPQQQQYSVPQPPSYAPPPPPPTTWKDYFIGATVGTLAVVGLVNLTKTYCPFEIRMKDSADQTKQQQQQQGQFATNLSSQPSITFPPPQGMNNNTLPPPPLSGGPSGPTVAELQGQLDSSKASLTKAEEEITKLRKERVDLQSNAAKTRGELQTLNRKVDVLQGENQRLQTELDAMAKQLKSNLTLTPAAEGVAPANPDQPPADPAATTVPKVDQPAIPQTDVPVL
eukprot:PhF_6_TR27382/c0_g1_i1/m.40292/K13343/PEX14; peroxin-14